MTDQQQPEATDRRLSRLETQAAETRTQQSSLFGEVHELKNALDGFMGEVRGYMQTAGRANWSVLVAFGMLILAIGALAASPFMRDLDRLDAKSDRNDERIDAIAESRWSREQHDAYRAQTRAELDVLRQALVQQEIRAAALNAEQTTRLTAIEETADKLLERFEVHVENGHPHTVIDRLDATTKLVHELRERLTAAEVELARRSTTVERVEAEQDRRTGRVYSGAP